jgi:prolyl oligopeptidase
MRQTVPISILLAALLAPSHLPSQSQTAPASPPVAKVDPVSTNYFGTTVVDPYRWMEAGTADPQFLAFLHAQNDYTHYVLASLRGRDALLARIHDLANAVPSVNGWQRGGNAIFFLETDPGASTASLRVRDANGQTRTLLDPASMDQDQSHAAINYFAPSPDGHYVAVGVSLGGSEDATLHFVETVTAKLLPDAITRTQYALPSWTADSKSLFYARLQKLDPSAPPTAIYENERTFLHTIGTDPESDHAVFGHGVGSSADVPKAGFTEVGATPGSPWLLGSFSAGTVDRPSLYLARADQIATPSLAWKRIISPEDLVSTGADSSITLHASALYLLLDKDAPNRKLVLVDLDHPNIAQARVLVPSSGEILTGVYAAEDGLYLSSKQGVHFRLRRAAYGDESHWQEVPLPASGTLSSIDASVYEPGVLFGLESWTQSIQAWRFDPRSGQTSNTTLVTSNPADFSAVEAREVLAPSADGTPIPLSIICRKDIVLDGSHPTLYEGYGAYGVSIDSYFDPRSLAWIERGGVMAIAHVRGGGEFGESWHDAGRKQTKQHTIDDMIAAAHYLIDHRYSSPQHLAVMGASAGGIAVGGSLVQHPELFVAAIDNVGVTDLLRFQNTQGGAANVPEFGDVTNADDFKNLYATAPYNHVVDGTRYPAVLAITGANDPRVPSWIVAKMAARLQAATSSHRSVLLRVDFDEGHGIGSSRPQRERLFADMLSFILWQSGDPDFQPSTPSAKAGP